VTAKGHGSDPNNISKPVLNRFESLFTASDNQFGFKKDVGCNYAIRSVRCIVYNFITGRRHSSVMPTIGMSVRLSVRHTLALSENNAS